jgi:hypothetical protein
VRTAQQTGKRVLQGKPAALRCDQLVVPAAVFARPYLGHRVGTLLAQLLDAFLPVEELLPMCQAVRDVEAQGTRGNARHVRRERGAPLGLGEHVQDRQPQWGRDRPPDPGELLEQFRLK